MIKLNFLQSIGGIWESCQTNCHTSSKSYYALLVYLRFLWFICCTFAHIKWRLFIAMICDSRYTNTISGSIYSWKGYSLPKGFQVSLHREIFLKPLAVTFYSKTYTQFSFDGKTQSFKVCTEKWFSYVLFWLL